jgi:hypothetical protein
MKFSSINSLLLKTIPLVVIISVVALFLLPATTGCNVYKFVDVSIPDSIKTVKVNFIDNKARYVNPQLSPKLTDKLRQKIVNQTRLNQTNKDDAHYDISGFISEYSVTTSAITNQQVATNRLIVGVHIVLFDRLSNKKTEFDITRNFDFSANLSLQAAESSLTDEIIRNMTDDIFNRIFSNW